MRREEQKRARVLVVEDYEPFRRFVTTTIQQDSNFQIDCEVGDGALAVQSAGELYPDLILLDIGLPTLNGMEAASIILRGNPEAKVLFLTQESSPELVQEAFRLGAWAYVLKTDASTELMSAMRTVLGGSRFMSSSCRLPRFCRGTMRCSFMGRSL